MLKEVNMLKEYLWLIGARAAGIRFALCLPALFLGLSLIFADDIFDKSPSFAVLRGIPE